MKYHLSLYTINAGCDEKKVFLYNTFSGSIIKLNIDEYNKLTTSLDESKIEHFKELKKQGFIVNEFENEYLKLKVKSREVQQTDLVTTLSYVIAPTLNCNYNCTYCFESKENRMQKMNIHTSDDIIKFIINQISKIKTIKRLK